MDEIKVPKNPVLDGLEAGWSRAVWPDGTPVHITEPEQLPEELYLEISRSVERFQEKVAPLRFLPGFDSWITEYRAEIRRLMWAGFNAGRDQG